MQWSSARFSGWNPFWTMNFPVEMRAIPTTTIVGTWGTNNAGSWTNAGYKTKMSATLGFSGTTTVSYTHLRAHET